MPAQCGGLQMSTTKERTWGNPCSRCRAPMAEFCPDCMKGLVAVQVNQPPLPCTKADEVIRKYWKRKLKNWADKLIAVDTK